MDENTQKSPDLKILALYLETHPMFTGITSADFRG